MSGRPFRLLVLAGLLALLAWWGIGRRSVPPPASKAVPEVVGADGVVNPGVPVLQPPPPEARAATAGEPPSALASPPAAAVRVAGAPGATRQDAFRFVLADQKVTLEAVEEIVGQFHPRRRGMAWEAGMFYVRLLDASARVLAEETMDAPDRTCVVLDPHVPDSAGRARPATLTPSGPVVFQVRMPQHRDAVQVRIYRLDGAPLAEPGAEPAGRLLAAIPLTR